MNHLAFGIYRCECGNQFTWQGAGDRVVCVGCGAVLASLAPVAEPAPPQPELWSSDDYDEPRL
jgi:hypothetical protein